MHICQELSLDEARFKSFLSPFILYKVTICSFPSYLNHWHKQIPVLRVKKNSIIEARMIYLTLFAASWLKEVTKVAFNPLKENFGNLSLWSSRWYFQVLSCTVYCKKGDKPVCSTWPGRIWQEIHRYDFFFGLLLLEEIPSSFTLWP